MNLFFLTILVEVVRGSWLRTSRVVSYRAPLLSRGFASTLHPVIKITFLSSMERSVTVRRGLSIGELKSILAAKVNYDLILPTEALEFRLLASGLPDTSLPIWGFPDLADPATTIAEVIAFYHPTQLRGEFRLLMPWVGPPFEFFRIETMDRGRRGQDGNPCD